MPDLRGQLGAIIGCSILTIFANHFFHTPTMSTTKRGKSSKGTAANQETGSGNKYRDFNNTAFDSLTNDVKKLKQNLKELDDKIEDSKIDNLNENGEFHTDLKRRL